MRTLLSFLFGSVMLLVASSGTAASISVIDDAGMTVSMQQPARRIVTLSPHAAELIHAAGAGDYLVGVSEFSDYPPAVKTRASVGNSATLDIERILALKPDLIVAWTSGNSAKQLTRLRQMEFTVYQSEPRNFETIASSLERLSRLTGTEQVGKREALHFRQRWQELAARYQDRPPVRVFYQIWRAPLMTVNDQHLVSQALHLCGGQNVFGHLAHLAPAVSMESVLQANPQAIITTGEGENDPLGAWRRLEQLDAVKHENLFLLNADYIHRPTPRVLIGVQALCEHLETARGRLPASSRKN